MNKNMPNVIVIICFFLLCISCEEEKEEINPKEVIENYCWNVYNWKRECYLADTLYDTDYPTSACTSKNYYFRSSDSIFLIYYTYNIGIIFDTYGVYRFIDGKKIEITKYSDKNRVDTLSFKIINNDEVDLIKTSYEWTTISSGKYVWLTEQETENLFNVPCPDEVTGFDMAKDTIEKKSLNLGKLGCY